MEAFSSYNVEITHTTGARSSISTTIADSSNLAESSISNILGFIHELNCDKDLMNSILQGDNDYKVPDPDPEVVGLTIQEYCDDDDDSNTSTNRNNKVATLQLCWGNTGILIQLLHLKKIPSTLKDFLANENGIAFVGVGIRDALAKLEKDYGLRCKSKPIDLGPVASRVCRKPEFFDSTLEVLARDIAEIDIEKLTIPSLTLWGARNLRNEQIDYAMTKAYASYLIGTKMMKKECPRT